MFLLHLCLALIMALFMTAIYRFVPRRQYPMPSILFFIIVFLGVWLGGVWITPVGPSVWNVHWLPFFLASLIFVLLMLAIKTQINRRRLQQQDKDVEKENVTRAALGSFFWVLIVLLILGIVMHYVGVKLQPLPILPTVQ
jgi:DMSO reductase anchor subunit